MRRHYLKIPQSIQNWYPGGAPPDWKIRAFDDATERGTRLTFHPLAPNDLGPRAAVYGDEFYFEVGGDRSRTDTLYLTRIERAKELTRIPRSTECEIRLWPGGVPATLDGIADLLGDEGPRTEVTAEASRRPVPAPSHLLLAALSETPTDVRERFRPQPASSTPKEFLDPLRVLWTRHRLDRLIEPSGRQIALLRGAIQPSSLPDSERDELMALFGFSLLNRLGASGFEGHAELERILRVLADVPDPPTKLAIWSAMTCGLSSGQLRRELFESREGLAALSDGGARLDRVCADSLTPLLLSGARRDADSALAAVLEATHAGSAVLRALAQWANGLKFSEGETSVEAPATVTSAAGGVVAGVARRSGVVDRWVLRLRGLGKDQVQSEVTAIRGLVERSLGGFSDSESVQGLSLLLSIVEQLRGDAAAWLKRLPDSKELVRDRDEADVALAGAEALLGEEALELVDGSSTLTPKELNEIIGLFGNIEFLRAAPSWLWSVGAETNGGTAPPGGLAMARGLCAPTVRARLQYFVECLTRLGQPVAARWLPPLPAGRPVDEHLREWFDKAQEFFVEVPPEIQKILHSEGSQGADLNVLLSNATRVGQLHELLSQEVAAELLVPLAGCTAADLSIELDALIHAVEFFRTHVGLDVIGAKAIQKRAEKESGQTISTLKPGLDDTRISVDHNWIDASGSRATLTLAKPADGAPFVEIAAPLALQISQPSTVAVRIQWQLKSLRDAWPDEWPAIEPSEAFTVYPQDWRANPSGGYLHSFVANFPVRVPRGERLGRLEVVASVRDQQSGRALSDPKSLRWDQLEGQAPDVVVQWADATDPSYIKQHPIGPQEKVATLLQRLQGGSSLAVIAPRRFGKSTLAEYLAREAASAGLAMPPAIWCTEFWSPAGVDYQRLWDQASVRLKSILGAEIGSSRQGFLPGPDAFDHVRTVAHDRGLRAVVLLFDEAQLFFPAQGGFELGSDLKRLLELHWARSEGGMVPLLVGFVGLPSLRHRVGVDLMGLLNPIEKATMEESELKPLIAHMVKGLQTTREARHRLATAAGNLFILRALLERLATHVNREQRRWAAYSDVFQVEESLRRDLQRALPESETVGAYVRDILNEAERVEDWKPISAFPVAVAIAQERQAGRSWKDVEDKVTEVLNQWCLAIADEDVRPTYDRALVGEHIQGLRERGVLRDEEFSSRLLEAWLLGVGARIRHSLDEPFKEALLKGAQRRIQIPEGVLRVATGGQAEIIRYGDRAFRVRPLLSESDRQHYMETVRVLQRVKDIWSGREAGSDHLFEPIEIGLSLRNSSEAVQVYRWVEGRDLSDRRASLSAEVVIEIGLKLGRAVALLHRNNILHRDICPRNIILADVESESLHPVLIDFGFARVAEGQTSTAFAGDHFAPEVCSRPAFWSKAADVFGLASTLKSLLATDPSPSDLVAYLDRALVQRPEDRPDVGCLCVDLEALSEKLRLGQRRETAWGDIQKKLHPNDKFSAWVMPLLRQNRSSLVALVMGFSHDYFDRCRSVADFLNKTAETCPIRTARLSIVESRLVGEEAKAMQFARALRNDRSHGEDTKFESTRQLVAEFRGLTADRQKHFILLATERIGQACKFLSLEPIVNALLDARA